MTAVSILPLEPDGHVETAIPWYVNGTLPAAERARVEAHFVTCSSCRASHQTELRLIQQFRVPESPESLPQEGWEALLRRLDANQSPQSSWPARRRTSRSLISIVLLAQAAAIAAIAFVLLAVMKEVTTPRYRTLTESTASTLSMTPTLRVVFSDDATNAEIQSLLARIGGTISGGPTASNVYTVELTMGLPADARQASPHRADEAARWLRAQPEVRFAEPVGTQAP